MRTGWKVVLGIVMLAGLLGIGLAIYQFGYAGGAAGDLGYLGEPRFVRFGNGDMWSPHPRITGRLPSFTHRGTWLGPGCLGWFGYAAPVLIFGSLGLLVFGAIAAIVFLLRPKPSAADGG